MDRRKFIKQNIAATSLAGLGPLAVSTSVFDEVSSSTKNQFKLSYVPYLGMFKEDGGGRSYSLT